MLLLQGRISPKKKKYHLMGKLAVLGSKGIVVKCTAAIFFHTVDCYTSNHHVPLLACIICFVVYEKK